MSEHRRFGRFADENGSALAAQPEQVDSLEAADREIFGGQMIERRPRVPENALVKREDGAFVYKQFILRETGMEIPEGTDEAAWQDVGTVLLNLESALAWWVGDWAVYANEHWKVSAKQIAAVFDLEPSTIETYLSVAKAVPGMIRNHTVSFSHHRLVAGLPLKEQDRWLADAAFHEWTLAEMRKAMAKPSTKTRLIADDVKDDWAFIWSLDTRTRTPDERNLAQNKIEHMRKALDEVERKLWED